MISILGRKIHGKKKHTRRESTGCPAGRRRGTGRPVDTPVVPVLAGLGMDIADSVDRLAAIRLAMAV
jgi:hypothetical protein